jgi:hypothetical protein
VSDSDLKRLREKLDQCVLEIAAFEQVHQLILEILLKGVGLDIEGLVAECSLVFLEEVDEALDYPGLWLTLVLVASGMKLRSGTWIQ